MQIRQFEASNIKEAVLKVRESLGPQAIILSTSEEIYRGKPCVIVTAAADRQASSPILGLGNDSSKERVLYERSEELSGEMRFLDMKDKRLKSALLLLRNMIDQALQNQYGSRKSPSHHWIELLMDRGVERATAYALVFEILSDAETKGQMNDTLIEQLQKGLMRLFRVTGGIKLTEDSPRFIVFLGPPGVGKTTTLAKLAAYIKKACKRPLVLLSTDVYRIGAMDQLHIYGNLMGVPVEAIRVKRDLRKTLNKYPGNTLFLVDTTGRSHTDDQGLMEIKILIDDMAKEMCAYLLLDAGKKREDLLDEIKGFSLFPFQSLIWTKVDETGMPGEMINVALRTKLPVSYITTGQNVPGDIEEANPRRLAEIILTNKESRRFLWTKPQN